jgi:hypothetical protein
LKTSLGQHQYKCNISFDFNLNRILFPFNVICPTLAFNRKTFNT